MAVQCIPRSVRFDVTPKVEAPCGRFSNKSLSQRVLQNSNISLQVRFSRHCTRGIIRHSRQWSGATGCVRAGELKPTWVEMVQITGEAQFDEVLESGNPIIIDWMAAWCRKCIYLKPKLEKLAAEFHPDIKFFFVDVNTVPSTLMARAQVTKMPTIQLWKNKEKAGEVIGGDQGKLVMEKVRDMLIDKI
ncbi:hypothetical protein KC19_1G297700 [Ceratodon purpureus]|uniref:Thioredoxin domain-containing protein n=1 Tax=Ceratodon purpureus TaxID=3225 RepID=A0A8T0JB63_CERPU|nr:hypothetical protein KC19_1G297700 [Ceratodon purpureus]